jgi:hypothetical protein
VDRAYRASTRATAVITFLLGLAMIAVTIVRGGGVLAIGVLAGVLFAALGAVRYRHATRAGA